MLNAQFNKGRRKLLFLELPFCEKKLFFVKFTKFYFLQKYDNESSNSINRIQTKPLLMGTN